MVWLGIQWERRDTSSVKHDKHLMLPGRLIEGLTSYAKVQVETLGI